MARISVERASRSSMFIVVEEGLEWREGRGGRKEEGKW